MFTRLILLLVSLAILPISLSQAQSPAKLKSDEEELRQMMVTMSRQLGVTCTACHNPENFKSSQKLEFRVAKEHMKITQLLIDSGMNGKTGPKASCYMCHRGEIKPRYQETLAPEKK